MKDINILITSISAKVLLVKAFKKALKEESNQGKIIGIDIDENSAGLYFCDKRFICPKVDAPDYLDFITNLCKDEEISLIIPSRDADVRFFSKNKEAFLSTKVMVANPESVRICYDKLEFSDFLKQNQLPGIKTWQEISPEIKYPCIIKPRTGAASSGFKIINSEKELREAWKEGLIIQEFVKGVEHTVDYFANFEGKALSIVPRIRLKIITGESKIGLTIYNKEIISQTKLLAEKLRLIGHNVIQCFALNDGSIKFIEVNPRFGGASNLSFAAGRPTPQFLVRMLQGKEINVKPFKKNLLMLRYSEDLFIEK